jgi:hypothetical protein
MREKNPHWVKKFKGVKRLELKKPITHLDVVWCGGAYYFSLNDEEGDLMILSGYAGPNAFIAQGE